MTIGWDGKVYGNYAYYPSNTGTPTYGDVTNELKPGGLNNYNELINGYDLAGAVESIYKRFKLQL